MYKAYKFRIYRDTEQQQALAKAFGCCRWYWNYSLELCQKTYQKTGKSLSRGAIQGLLPGLKKEYPWLSSAYSQCLQFVALNLSLSQLKISLIKERSYLDSNQSMVGNR